MDLAVGIRTGWPVGAVTLATEHSHSDVAAVRSKERVQERGNERGNERGEVGAHESMEHEVQGQGNVTAVPPPKFAVVTSKQTKAQPSNSALTPAALGAHPSVASSALRLEADFVVLATGSSLKVRPALAYPALRPISSSSPPAARPRYADPLQGQLTQGTPRLGIPCLAPCGPFPPRRHRQLTQGTPFPSKRNPPKVPCFPEVPKTWNGKKGRGRGT